MRYNINKLTYLLTYLRNLWKQKIIVTLGIEHRQSKTGYPQSEILSTPTDKHFRRHRITKHFRSRINIPKQRHRTYQDLYVFILNNSLFVLYLQLCIYCIGEISSYNASDRNWPKKDGRGRIDNFRLKIPKQTK